MAVECDNVNLVLSQVRQRESDMTMTEDFLRASRRKTYVLSFEDADDAIAKMEDISKPLSSVTVTYARRGFATENMITALVELLAKSQVSAIHFVSCDVSLKWVCSVLIHLRLSTLEQLTLPVALPGPKDDDWLLVCNALPGVTHVSFSEQRVYSSLSRQVLSRALGEPFDKMCAPFVLPLLEQCDLAEFSCDAEMSTESASTILAILARRSAASLRKLELHVKNISGEVDVLATKDRDPRLPPGQHVSLCQRPRTAHESDLQEQTSHIKDNPFRNLNLQDGRNGVQANSPAMGNKSSNIQVSSRSAYAKKISESIKDTRRRERETSEQRVISPEKDVNNEPNPEQDNIGAEQGRAVPAVMTAHSSLVKEAGFLGSLSTLVLLQNLSLYLPSAADASEASHEILRLAEAQRARRMAATITLDEDREDRIGMESLRLIGSFSSDALTSVVRALPRLRHVEIGSAKSEHLLLRTSFFEGLCSKLELLSVYRCQILPEFTKKLIRLPRLRSLILRDVQSFGLDASLAEFVRASPSLGRVWLDSGKDHSMPLPLTCEELFRRVQIYESFAAFVDNDAFVWEKSWLRCMIDLRSPRNLTLERANAVCRGVWNFFHRSNLAMMSWVTKALVRNCMRRVEAAQFVPPEDENIVEVFAGLCLAMGVTPVHLRPDMRLIGVPCEALWKHKRKLDRDEVTAAEAHSDLLVVSDVVGKVNRAKNTAVLRASCGVEFSLVAAVAHLIIRRNMSLNEALCVVMADIKPSFFPCSRMLKILENVELGL